MSGWDQIWYTRGHWLSAVLLPFGWLFAVLSATRRRAYRIGLLRSVRLPVPVVVVGNITVGGTGKTPVVALLVEHLRAGGLRPGIITRGYGGRASSWPQAVGPDSDPGAVGDEAVMLAAHCGCPVVAAPDRVLAGQQLLAHNDCDVLVSDDGLQHLRLARQLEVAVLDGVRLLGNGRPLPAGPLREPPDRLATVDLVLVNGAAAGPSFQLVPQAFVRLDGREADCAAFAGRSVDAIAGIGHPARFFDSLRALDITPGCASFPDHHPYVAADLVDFGGSPLVMTEKDAVKVRRLEHPQDSWFLRVRAVPNAAAQRALAALVEALRTGSGTRVAPSP